MKSKLLEIVNDKKLRDILQQQALIFKDKVHYEFNIFTLSKSGTQLENFHSDILHHLLNPEGPHLEGRKFLDAFLRYLNNLPNKFNVNLGEFKNAKVHKELAKLDISIVDLENKKVIIIENKINNAPDQDNQLLRYFNWCKSQHLEVVGIVYLSLNKLKYAPVAGIPIIIPVCNIQAFSNLEGNLVNNWLVPCIALCENNDSRSLLIQYKKLLIYLAYESMEEKVMHDVYEILNTKELIERINKIKTLSDGIPRHRTNEFVREIGDNYTPFTKSNRYRDNHILYEDFFESNDKFKLDVVFEPDGSVNIHFWNPAKEESPVEASKSINDKIIKISFESQFSMSDSTSQWVRCTKSFSVSDYINMPTMDVEVIKFVKTFLKSLNN
ncbi:PDDEXK-like family protein [Confluentibacter citreus]|uniref:PDDEXK-like family protein n=1 Tax=Confluentibacter citreus TaxID=2007307 RepID=UPI000C2875C7|nr:PD-(D/E)XK nuclease family protein [Confluentibacter citreus]